MSHHAFPRFVFKAAALGLLSLLLFACTYNQGTPPPPTIDFGTQAATSVEQTLAARMTEAALLVTASPTATPSIEAPPTETLTPAPPTSTPWPTFTPTPLPTSTPPATPTATQLPCNLADFIDDITVEDGANFPEAMGFTKTWRVKNTGSCTWDDDYRLVYSSGNKMGAEPLSVPLPKDVKPGELVDISIKLKSPDKEGDYASYWELQSGSGTRFGVGANGAQQLWVKIKVYEFNFTKVYDFAELFCRAAWSSASSALPCQGRTGDSRGFAQFLARPKFEDGYVDDEPALLVFPQAVEDGWIMGEFPAFTVKDGDKFVAKIGCLYDQENCRVTFRLDYRNQNGKIKTLATWTQKYDGNTQSVEVDLSELANKTVNFILYVDARGAPSGDYAYWFAPYIER